jgi:hypothetical protein
MTLPNPEAIKQEGQPIGPGFLRAVAFDFGKTGLNYLV